MKNFFFHVLSKFFAFSRVLFMWILTFYLVLFLLENLFPGFVSNNFDLNWILVGVCIVGLFTFFAPEIPQTQIVEVSKKEDYFLILLLGFFGVIIPLAKLHVAWLLQWTIAVVSGLLIMAISYITLLGEEKAEEKIYYFEHKDHEKSRNTISTKKLKLIFSKRILQLLLRQRIQLPLAYIILFVFFTASLIPKNFSFFLEKLKNNSISQNTVETPSSLSQSSSITTYNEDNASNPSIEPIKNTPIEVLNGGSVNGSAASFSSLFQADGFTEVSVGNADKQDYKDALLQFNEKDEQTALYLYQLVKQKYSVVNLLPSEDTQTGITLILGKKRE